MFWQYGSNLNTLGDKKIDGVNVVSPTWYELKIQVEKLHQSLAVAIIQRQKNMGIKFGQ